MQQEDRSLTGSYKELQGMELLQKHSLNVRIVHVLQQHNKQSLKQVLVLYPLLIWPWARLRHGIPEQYMWEMDL